MRRRSPGTTMVPFACALVAALLVAPLARAGDARADATAAYNAGMDLRAAGKASLALAELQRAHALYPTAITGLELGRTLMLLGRLREAREALASVARIGPRANESARANNARAEAAALAVEMNTRIPKLRFRHEGAPPAVSVDGVVVTDVDSLLELDPGTHDVDIARGPTHERQRVVLEEGKSAVVELGGAREAALSPGPVAAPTATSPSRTWFWIGVAATGASLALGGVSGTVALVNANDAAPGCVQDHCSPAVASQVDAAQTWSTVSTVSFVAAGAFAIFALVAYVLSPASSPKRSLALAF